jgi:DNA-directed RNA polymerase specialized sigma24 family protein
MDDEESVVLVAGALGGDGGAVERLVAGLTPVIQARVARTLLTRGWGGGGRDIRSEVEDLSQDIFMRLFAKDGRVLRRWKRERGLSLENFVGLVSERYVRSFLRSVRRNRSKEVPTANEDLVDVRVVEPDAERLAASRERLQLLLDRLRQRVSPMGWQIFQLLFVQELSVPEAMAASGLSADAVYAWRSRLRRLARKLRSE